jgi:hypothetical protein
VSGSSDRSTTTIETREVATALLWEADPALFAARYPDSGVIETYGEERWQDVTCIDFWVYLDLDKRQCRLSVEGGNLPELLLDLHGDSGLDGHAIANTFSRLLAVGSRFPPS